MSSSMKAAIHLGPNHLTNVEIYENTNFEEIESLLSITQKIMEHPEEILNVKFHLHPGRDQCDLMIKRSNGQRQKYVSLLIPFWVFGHMKDSPEAIERWRGQVEGLRLYSSHQDAVGIDGETIDFEWKKTQDFQHCLFFKRTKKLDEKEHSDRRVQGQDHLYVNVQWHWVVKKKNEENCVSSAEKVKNYAMKFSQWHWVGRSGMGNLLRESRVKRRMEFHSRQKW